MSRYLVFAGNVYYASGGWWDFKCSHNTLDGALTQAVLLTERQEDREWYEWYHIVDTTTGLIVAKSETLPYH